MKVGPVSASAEQLKASEEGEGGVAGFAKGGATVTLLDKDDGTVLICEVDAQIGGKLAQLGQRLINGSAKSSQTSSSPTSPKRPIKLTLSVNPFRPINP
jgi:carbon monoxide dehydrogenase subunit G